MAGDVEVTITFASDHEFADPPTPAMSIGYAGCGTPQLRVTGYIEEEEARRLYDVLTAYLAGDPGL